MSVRSINVLLVVILNVFKSYLKSIALMIMITVFKIRQRSVSALLYLYWVM